MVKIAFKPTEEQKKIFFYIQKRTENILIEARAGCGKTTTIVEATKLLPKDSEITFLAFNKHIQQELKERLPENIRCYTTHGLGLAAIKRKYGDSIKFDEFKVDHILRKKSKKWNLNKEFDSVFDINQYLNELKRFIKLCRLTLTFDKKWMLNIAERYDIKYSLDKDIKRVASVMEFLMNDRTSFDFTDMVFLPAIDNKIWLFPQDVVLLDEAQDFNRAQQKIVEKMLKKDKVNKSRIIGRLISVGDDFQSIYGFGGSSNSSFNWFRNFKNTKVLPLTYTFRCAKEIVKRANEIVRDIKPLENADQGLVRNGSVLDEPESGDFVLCRTTAPLINLFFKYLLEGKKAIIKGSEIGISLIEMTSNHKTPAQLMAYWTNKLEEFRVDLRKNGILNYNEHTGYIALEDKVNALNFLARLSKNIYDLRDKISKIFRDDIDGIVLSTVHKAKGLEANRVFIARPDKLPLNGIKGWQYIQEKNLEYVAITRAKKELIYDYDWNDEENV